MMFENKTLLGSSILASVVLMGAGVVAQPLSQDAQSQSIQKQMLERVTTRSYTQAMNGALHSAATTAAANNNPSPKAQEIGDALRAAMAKLGKQSVAQKIPGRNAATQSQVKGLAAVTPQNGRGKKLSIKAPGGVALSFNQHQAVNRLQQRVAQQLNGGLRVHLSESGTPRELRAAASSPSGGITAQSAGASQVMQLSVGTPMQTARTFLRDNASVLLLNDPDSELALSDESRDELGRTHLNFKQSYKGVPVWASNVRVHLDATGGIDLVNGAYNPTPQKLSTTPSLSEQSAAKLALAAVADAVDGNTPLAVPPAVQGPGQKMIVPRKSGSARLAWQFRVNAGLDQSWLVHIDANNGAVLNAFNEVNSMGTPGSGADSFGISRDVGVFEQSGTFFMVDTSKLMFDPTSTPPSASTTRGGIIILDAGNLPGDPTREPIPQNNVTNSTANGGWIPDAVSASFGFSETYDYFLERHNLNSLDNQGSSITATVRVGQNLTNAFFVPAQQAMFFGTGDVFAGALDVVGHELAHGVVNNSSNLVYQDQSGALNESFADIMGTLVQARTNGSIEWVIGDQFSNVGLQRNMQNPNSLISPLGVRYPMRMSQFVRTNDDNGGVHVNSSIPNHAFFLYTAGLPNAVGIADAERVFFRAFTVHLTQNSQFIDARLAVIRAAEEIFGADAPQVSAARDAFDAVEIFDAPQSPGPTPFPEVDGPDSAIAVSFNPNVGAAFLIRREEALGDSQFGNQLSVFDLAFGRRPVASGDGSFVVFVDSLNDLCIIPTDGSAAENCLGFVGQVHQATMTPNGDFLAFILRDQFGNPDNQINVSNLTAGVDATFELVAPALDGVATNSVAFADAMDFTSDGRLLIYDGLNIINLGDGSQVALWSIFGLDLATGRTLSLAPPVPGVDLTFPTISQATDRFFTFDAFDQSTGQSTVLAVDLETGQGSPIALIQSGFGVPGYTGDDSAIVYSQFDPSVPTGFTLLRQALATDRLTPVGAPEVFLPDADFGVIYRRGTFSGAPDVNLVVEQQADAQSVSVGQTFNYNVSVRNLGTDPSENVVLTDTIPEDVTLGTITTSQGSCQVSGNQVTCSLGSVGGSAQVNLTVPVTPTATGTITSAVTAAGSSNDSDSDDNSAVSTVIVVSAGAATSRPAAAVLPGSRSVQLGVQASAFATILNTSEATIDGCTISPLSNVPAQFFFQTSDRGTNELTGTPNTPVSIVGGGQQSFVIGFTPTEPFAPTEVQLGFDCGNTDTAFIVEGVNTLLVSGSSTPVADLVALGATPTNDGIVNIAGAQGSAAFAVASVNTGAAAVLNVRAESTNAALPITLNVCETNPDNGQCLAPPAPSVGSAIAGGATPTFSVFISASDAVGFDPANNRIRVIFEEGSTVRGATSVAVRTQ